jgi:heptaprenyl diphosphate synthase
MWEKYPEILKELEILENYIKKNTHSRNKLLSKVVEELVSAGGKRLRPAFSILSAKFGKYDRDKLLPVAGAIEILHTATLVHDDIIDRADFRRGVPTVSEKYGADMAVYTGDYLLARAVLMLSGSVRQERLDVIAKAVKTICEGEVDQYIEKFDFDSSIRKYLKRIGRKTAVLFGASCLIGAEVSECDERVAKLLARFGLYYGMAFQMKDDLLDFLSSARETGKPVGNDISKGIITLPVIFAMTRNSELKTLFKKYSGRNAIMSIEDIKFVNETVKVCGGFEAAGSLLEKYIKKSNRILDKLEQNEYSRILRELVENLRN